MIALTVALGRWQLGRGEEKASRQALLEARGNEAPILLGGSSGPAEALLYRRVRARGTWSAEGQVFVDNQVDHGRAGYHVITPLRLAGSPRAVLVNRGWIARGPAYPQPPAVAVPAGEVEVQGLAALPPRRVLELSSETVTGNVWQNLSIARYEERMRVALVPVVVLADPPATGLAPVHERPGFGVEKHQEYALTWFSLATLAAVLWIVFSFRRPPA
jgi:surfeit locus 1 family protein